MIESRNTMTVEWWVGGQWSNDIRCPSLEYAIRRAREESSPEQDGWIHRVLDPDGRPTGHIFFMGIDIGPGHRDA